MRSQLLVLAAAVFMILVFPHIHVEAAISGDDGGTVAEHFQKNSSEDTGNVGKQQNQKEQLVASSSSTVWMFVKVLLVLAVVIALIYFLLKFVNARTKSFTNDRAVQNVGGVSVGSNRSVQLVKVGDRVFIVGVGESVSLLKELNDPDEVSELLDENSREDVIDHSIWKFRDWLKKVQAKENTGKHSGNFKEMLEGRLKQMKQERKEAAEQLEKKEPRK